MHVNLESRTLWAAVFGGLLLIYGGFLVFSRSCLRSPAVPPERAEQLRVGMTMDEVLALLGRPLREKSVESNAEWHFGHRLKRHLLVVRFGKDRRVLQFEHVSHYDFGRGQAV